MPRINCVHKVTATVVLAVLGMIALRQVMEPRVPWIELGQPATLKVIRENERVLLELETPGVGDSVCRLSSIKVRANEDTLSLHVVAYKVPVTIANKLPMFFPGPGLHNLTVSMRPIKRAVYKVSYLDTDGLLHDLGEADAR